MGDIANDEIPYEFVDFDWVDLSGVTRRRVLTNHFAHQIKQGLRTISLLHVLGSWPLVGTPDRQPPPGDVPLRPDWSTLRRDNSRPGHAGVICSLSYPPQPEQLPTCPRVMLQSVCKDAKETAGLDFLVGFEIEFVLIDLAVDPKLPIDNIPIWTGAAGLRNKYYNILVQCVRHIVNAGIAVEQHHNESPRGLHEIILAPSPPCEAVDNLVRAQEIIRHTYRMNDILATLFPKPTSLPTGVGQHAHVSVSPADVETHFLAGVIDHLPALCAIGMANYDSYVRVKDAAGTMGTWISWGLQLRDVPIRKIKRAHWEMRFVDATANMYFAIASTLMAGLQGVRQRAQLTSSDPKASPSTLDPEVREVAGITRKLPTTFRDAITHLKHDELLGKSPATLIVQRFIELKKAEIEAVEKLSEEERRDKFLQFY
ncbi:Protein fluG [Pseudocercospora fuligena]|uniref:Glutamine synthetase n=1 Tax=Pseudocercospora fuligena TaxID=685502 RepID=A0A8H6RWH1_9PEZI|nr:Protein fluG [Pseudocercospora fuligena]